MSVQQLATLYEDLVDSISELLEKGDIQGLQRKLENHYPAEIALAMESLRHGERARLWSMLTAQMQGQVLHHLRDIARASLIEGLEPQDLVTTGESMDVDDLAEVVSDFPESVSQALITSLDEAKRRHLETRLSYAEDTAGRFMHTTPRTVRPEVTLDTALRYLRMYGLNTQTDSLMVVDRERKYLGKLYFTALLTGKPKQRVAEVMDTQADPIPANMPIKDVVNLFDQRDLVSVAVVDEYNTLLGRISVPDIVELIREEADHTLMNMAGLEEEEDLFAPVLPSTRRRAVWLGINLGTAFLASWVIGLFEATLDQIVALAVLMPIVASMGGIGGSQTLTLTIRGLALGQIGAANSRWLVLKEIAIGILNGLMWAVVVAVIAILWFGDYRIGGVIAAALLINMIAAAVAGIVIPLILDRLGIDPALSGAVVLTTVTDVVGFMGFLGLGTLILL